MTHELVVRRAHPLLLGRVDRYWGYDSRGDGPRRQQEPLSTNVVLIVGLGPKLRVVDPAHPDRPATSFGSLVGGLDDACTVIEHDGHLRGVQVDLSPLAARMIFGV